jgi:uncharacterized protein (TIGR03435 family)
MKNRVAHKVSLGRVLFLAAFATLSLAGPIMVGFLHGKTAQAQIPVPGAISGRRASESFAAAVIKPSPQETNSNGACRGTNGATGTAENKPPLGRCVIAGLRLNQIARLAYDLPTMAFVKVNGTFPWALQRFDIEAVAETPAETTKENLLLMLQDLLTDRFQMKAHREVREVQGFKLTVVSSGHKLAMGTGSEPSLVGGGDDVKGRSAASLVGRNATVLMLARRLTALAGGPVGDNTELNGGFDFRLTFDETAGPSLVTALQEQLGLRLTPQKVMAEYLVIDDARRPDGPGKADIDN